MRHLRVLHVFSAMLAAFWLAFSLLGGAAWWAQTRSTDSLEQLAGVRLLQTDRLATLASSLQSGAPVPTGLREATAAAWRDEDDRRLWAKVEQTWPNETRPGTQLALDAIATLREQQLAAGVAAATEARALNDARR